MREHVFELVVYGTAQPAGSKRALPRGGKGGGRPIIVDANKKSRPWKDLVSQEAGPAMADRDPFEGPLHMAVTFFRARPKGHMGTGRNEGTVRPSAPPYPHTRPDTVKLTRAIEDALEGVVFRNDAQVVTHRLEKRYGTPERVVILIRPELA